MRAKRILELTQPFLSRQMQVLLLWVLRFSYREIADAMSVTEKTVNSHLDRLTVRYDVDSLPELHRAALPEMTPFLAICGDNSPYTDSLVYDTMEVMRK